MLKQAETLDSLTSAEGIPFSTFNGSERRLTALERVGLLLSCCNEQNSNVPELVLNCSGDTPRRGSSSCLPGDFRALSRAE